MGEILDESFVGNNPGYKLRRIKGRITGVTTAFIPRQKLKIWSKPLRKCCGNNKKSYMKFHEGP